MIDFKERAFKRPFDVLTLERSSSRHDVDCWRGLRFQNNIPGTLWTKGRNTLCIRCRSVRFQKTSNSMVPNVLQQPKHTRNNYDVCERCIWLHPKELWTEQMCCSSQNCCVKRPWRFVLAQNLEHRLFMDVGVVSVFTRQG
jgi:hypothetical protein